MGPGVGVGVGVGRFSSWCVLIHALLLVFRVSRCVCLFFFSWSISWCGLSSSGGSESFQFSVLISLVQFLGVVLREGEVNGRKVKKSSVSSHRADGALWCFDMHLECLLCSTC